MTRRRLGALVAVAALVAAGAAARADGPAAPARTATLCTPQPGTRRLPVVAGRVPVVLHVGRGMRAGAPLILVLPGFDQTARDMAVYTNFSRLADRDGFAVAYPTATGSRPSWNIAPGGTTDDVAYLRRVIVAATAATCADPDRVGVTGVSNGGGMTARLACDATDLLAAAAPVAGGYRSLPDCRPSRPLPILEVHGVRDQVVPYAGRGPQGAGSVRSFLAQWRRLDSCPGRASRSTPSSDVLELRWRTCAGGSAVFHDRVADAEHGWPGAGDLDGRDAFATTPRVWRFLSSFRRPTG